MSSSAASAASAARIVKIQQEIRRKKATIVDIYPFLNDSNPRNIITATDIITSLTNQHNIETSSS